MPIVRYAITDRTCYGTTELERCAGVVRQAERLAAHNVDFIQLREKDLPAHDLIGLAREMLKAIRASAPSAGHFGTRLLINSRADVALVTGADGVHLPSGEDQLTAEQVQHIFEVAGAAKPIVSVSCHSLDEVLRAKRYAADLILFGPVFGKFSDDKIVVRETGVDALEAACTLAGETPVLALGGVTAANAATTIAAGAKGFAAIRLFR